MQILHHSSSSIRQQLFSKTISGGRWQRDISTSNFNSIEKHVELVEVFEVLNVWFQYFISKLLIHISRQQTYQKMDQNYLIASSMFCCCELRSSWGSRSWCCTKSRSCTRCCMYQTNDGAVPHMMFLDRTKSWCWTSSICGTSLWISSFSLRPSKNPKILLKTYTKKSRETFKNQRKTKRSNFQEVWAKICQQQELLKIAKETGDV